MCVFYNTTMGGTFVNRRYLLFKAHLLVIPGLKTLNLTISPAPDQYLFINFCHR
jgi:hypothetical protein